ncbi:3-hydroxyisobutyryl-CoA hydrolase [Acidocella aquatica]|uniref:3-hydroxyisobutyryl-CoA hydrolase n=2 Tax=Acidocella aquatica TaxID=1922313 RepID=A0ABQ6A4L8_9PROT|nr:3-hydroxyisobutyryl-CoA hydrolase [Acidocella aquatica]
MVKTIRAAVDEFGADPAVHVILVDTLERWFCSGGDVRMLHAGAVAGDASIAESFFGLEYAMNQAIADLRKPYVAIINGLCMGGGVGISVHGSHRIATENALLAMPETGIALFPDVGASYALPRMPGALGMYLGLTGARVTGADAVHTGFATHFVPSGQIAALSAAIVRDGVTAIAEYAAPLPPFTLAAERELIDRAFGQDSVNGIIATLEADGGSFAKAALAQLRQHSPSSVHWSFEIIRRGAARDLAGCLAAEYDLVCQIAMSAEFIEGVRALLVDKDKSPKWQPPRLEDVNPATIAALFAPRPR